MIDELKQSGMIADNEYGNAMVAIIESQPQIEFEKCEPVAAVKPEKKAKKKKRIVDYGKILSLHKAGWSQKKIAEEMGVSQNAICVSLKRYKEKMEEGYIWDAELLEFIRKENG